MKRLKRVAQGDLKTILMGAQFISCKDAGDKVDYIFKLNLGGYQPQNGDRLIDELEEVIDNNNAEIAAAWVNKCKGKVLEFLKNPQNKHYSEMLIDGYFYETNNRVKSIDEIPKEFVEKYLQDLDGYINGDFKDSIEEALELFDFNGQDTITLTTY
jgi:excinuclease UvrABC ATPase subunit